MWIIPHVLGGRTVAALTRVWDGSVRVGRIRFDYGGSATIDQISLEDSQGRPWAKMNGTRLDFSRSSRFAIGLTQITVERMDVDVYRIHPLPLIHGRALPAVRKATLHKSDAVKDMAVKAHANDVVAAYPEPLHLTLRQEASGYKFSLESKTPESSDDGCRRRGWWIRIRLCCTWLSA